MWWIPVTPLMEVRALSPGEQASPSLLEVAYHYEPYWGTGTGDWVKSLLLFFDGVALL